MVSADMAVQDKSGGTGSNGVLPMVDQISLDVSPNCVKVVPLDDKFPSANDYALKVRKPYTITKQRERWTEDEHKKFIEALKLYGRAWRRIEEHVGTKTAVQIRSHAQKFFSKVVRESSISATCSIKPVDIPPPRPKRKPVHPYPRKLIVPLKTGNLVAEKPRRSSSPNSSVSDQENQSPTSVLPIMESDILCAADSDSPSDSLSPVSAAAGANTGSFLLAEPHMSLEETACPLLAEETTSEQVSVKLELFPGDTACVKEVPAESSPTQSLKLFGKTVLVSDSNRATAGTCKSSPSDMNGRPAQELPCNLLCAEADPSTRETDHLTSEAPAAPHDIRSPNDKSNLAESSYHPPLIWWAFYGGTQIPILQQQKSILAEAHPPTFGGQTHFREMQKEGSCPGSKIGPVNVAVNGGKNVDIETGSHQLGYDKKEKEQLQKKPSMFKEKASFSEQRLGRDKYLTGFVPYKRCLAERDTRSSIIACEEREDKRIHLCL